MAQVFSLMESAKGNLGVQDYSVHQTTLEQVFLTFARAQVQAQVDKYPNCMTKSHKDANFFKFYFLSTAD